MNFQKTSEADFCTIQKFYWDVIDNIHKNNTENKNLGWEKGIVCDNSEVLTPHALAVNPDFRHLLPCSQDSKSGHLQKPRQPPVLLTW